MYIKTTQYIYINELIFVMYMKYMSFVGIHYKIIKENN
jgi:hypothetical protein